MDSQSFIEKMKQILPDVAVLEVEVREEFRPNPPGINSLCDRIGWFISENIDSIENAGDVFLLVEEAIKDGSSELQDAISTGLVEAMISESDHHPGKWDEISPLLGPQTAAYAKAWLNFTDAGKL